MNTLLKNVCKVKMKSIPKVNGQKPAKTLVGVATDRGVLKDDSAAYAVFTEQGSSASQMTAAKVMGVVARLPGCAGQAADAVSAYTQEKMEDAPRLFQIPKSECPDTWIRLLRHKWPKSWSGIAGPAVLLERNLYGHPLVGLLWRDTLRRFYWDWDGKVPNCECLFVHRKQGLFLSVYVDDIKMAGRTEYGSNVEEIDGTCWSWRTNIMSRSCIFGMHSTWM